MLKTIRYILLLAGLGIAIYGFVKDADLITFAGLFVLVITLTLRQIVKSINALK